MLLEKARRDFRFFQINLLFHWKHFTFKKAGIVDSESFKKYFDGIFGETTTLSELKFPPISPQLIWLKEN